MTNQKVIIRPTTSGRAFEKMHRPDGTYVLIADQATHEEGLRRAGAVFRDIVRDIKQEVRGGASSGGRRGVGG